MSVTEANGSVTFRSFLFSANGKRGICRLKLFFFPKNFQWEGLFICCPTRRTGFSIQKESAPTLPRKQTLRKSTCRLAVSVRARQDFTSRNYVPA